MSLSTNQLGDNDSIILPARQPTQAALVTAGTVGSLNIQGQGGVNSAPFQQQQQGQANANPQVPLPGDIAGMLGYLLALILGSNQTNLIWRLILITAFNFVAAAMIGVLFLPQNLEGVHTTFWRVMLMMTVGIPIVVAVITLLFIFWFASDPEGWSNWITGLSVANVSMLAGPLIVYWVLTGTSAN